MNSEESTLHSQTPMAQNDHSNGASAVANTESPMPEHTEAVRQPRNMKPLAWLILIVSLLSSDFLFALDNTIVADVQPKIILALGDIQKLPWVSVAFALGAIGCNLFWYV